MGLGVSIFPQSIDASSCRPRSVSEKYIWRLSAVPSSRLTNSFSSTERSTFDMFEGVSPSRSLSFSLPNALRAAGDARFTMIVSMVSMWVFRIGFSYLLGGAAKMGLMGVWVAMYIDWLVRSIVFTIRFARGKWKELRVI